MSVLYLLRRLKTRRTPTYDCSDGFVIRAVSEAHARVLASRTNGGEGPETWTDPLRSTCEVLRADGEPGVVLSDFNAG